MVGGATSPMAIKAPPKEGLFYWILNEKIGKV
jgi:hypothetical protein